MPRFQTLLKPGLKSQSPKIVPEAGRVFSWGEAIEVSETRALSSLDEKTAQSPGKAQRRSFNVGSALQPMLLFLLKVLKVSTLETLSEITKPR